MRRRGAIGAVAGVLWLAGVCPALAHDSLTDTDPDEGSTVQQPPASVSLTFSDNALAIGTVVKITGPDGLEVQHGDPTITGQKVTQGLVSGLPAGEYTVTWRVTSADGHPISDSFTFTAEQAGPAAPAGAAASTPATVPSRAPEQAAATPGTPAAQDDGGTTDTASLVVGGLSAALLAAGVYFTLARRRAH